MLLLALLLAGGCSERESPVKDRWYTSSQVKNGAVVFRNGCASCHGDEAQGIVSDWRQPLADGGYPPPPLNGSAHAWHHPLPVLKRTIRNGTIPLGGKMPPFKDKLTDKEIESAIAFFQHKWSDQIYRAWIKRGGLR